MRRTHLIALLLVTAGLLAETRAAEAQVIVYGVGGLGAHTGWFGSGGGWQASGGGEFLVKGVGGGAEFGGFGNFSSILFVTSFNGVVHFSSEGERTSPFLTAGYSRFSSGDGGAHAWNVGVGADFWRSAHTAIRADFRDHVRSDFRGTVHYIAVRLGVAFK